MHATQRHAIGELLTIIAAALQPTKPIAVLDLETTGVNVEQDRIVEITIARLEPHGGSHMFHSLVNPGRPIPVDAAAIHGITDEKVANEPSFRDIGSTVRHLLSGADLIGFHHRRFDVRLVANECRRVGLPDPCVGARLIDACDIFHKREPRDLAAALAFYCGLTHEDAHGTTADVIATLQVFVGQLGRYSDLPHDIDALHEIGRDPSWIDKDGKIRWKDGEAALGFGKHAGITLRQADQSYLRWVTNQDWCPTDTREILRRALKGEFPQPLAVSA